MYQFLCVNSDSRVRGYSFVHSSGKINKLFFFRFFNILNRFFLITELTQKVVPVLHGRGNNHPHHVIGWLTSRVKAFVLSMGLRRSHGKPLLTPYPVWTVCLRTPRFARAFLNSENSVDLQLSGYVFI